MDTYGDMVTLLLCFFVLLYSISTVDQNKWRLIVESFNPSAVNGQEQIVVDAKISPEDGEELISGSPPEQMTEEDIQFEELYLMLQQAIENGGIQDSVELTQGDGYTFISFRDQVFFDGDSSILRAEGKVILDELAEALRVANSAIKQIEVMGHTAQADPHRPNNIRNDRMLSAQRSAEVIIYIQSKDAVNPGKLVGLSFGQHHPIDTFDTAEGRAHNRRVEMLIMKNDAQEQSLEKYYEEVYNRPFTSIEDEATDTDEELTAAAAAAGELDASGAADGAEAGSDAGAEGAAGDAAADGAGDGTVSQE